MRQPKILTLDEALATTAKLIGRFGDLRKIDVFPGAQGTVEVGGIFMPDRDWSVKQFRQPETENCLRELYGYGGRIESLSHLSDKELALTYAGYAGIVKPSGVVGDAGDPSEFEQAYLEAIARLPQDHPPQWRTFIRETVLEEHRRLAPDAERGRSHSERQTANAAHKRPVRNDTGDTLDGVIGRLSQLHHNVAPSEIWTHLKSAIEDWSSDTVTESGQGDVRCYRFITQDNKPDTVKFSTFRKKLAAFRKQQTGI